VRFHNTSSIAVSFKLSGHLYQAPAGGEVSIPNKLAFGVKSRGLPLEPIAGSENDAVPPPPRDQSDAGTAKDWRARATHARAAAESADALVQQLEERLDEAQDVLAQYETVAADLRAKLAVPAGGSIVEAVAALQQEFLKARADLESATAPAALAAAQEPLASSAAHRPVEPPKAGQPGRK
jgi:hypothetical protein